MQGKLRTGDGVAATFVAAIEDQLTQTLGFRPYPGTLNLSVDDADIECLPAELLSDVGDDHCDGVHIRPCSVGGVRAAVLRPIVPDYPNDIVEIVAPIQLRTFFSFSDSDQIPFHPPNQLWLPNGSSGNATSFDLFDAVVFDLDGTLVDLDIPWEDVHQEIEGLLEDELGAPLIEHSRAEVMQIARDGGQYDELIDILDTYESAGAKTASQLPLLDVITDLDCPVGVCTANGRSAAERSLEHFSVLNSVDGIVARETVPEEKPHPRPLERVIDAFDTRAGNVVFVGDEQSDAETAVRAGTSFLRPEQLTD